MLNKTVTRDEKCVHQYQPAKRAWNKWKHHISPSTKSLRLRHYLWRLCLSCFAILREYCWPIFRSVVKMWILHRTEVLFNMRDAIRRKRPGQLARGVLLHHDNARPHTARATQEIIQELQRELLEHPPYSPDLVPSDFHLFGPLRYHLCCKRFADDEEAEMEARSGWDNNQSTPVLWVSTHR
jgi:histone-lysine N-methyltransferase SETMAR